MRGLQRWSLEATELEYTIARHAAPAEVLAEMKRTRHQLAPAVPVQKVIDRAVAGCVADHLVGRLQLGCPPPRRNVSTSRIETISLTSLLGRQRLHNCTTIWCVSSQTIHRCAPLRVLGRWTGRGYRAGGVDPRICRTFAASPAEPGELPLWFRFA
jgi:hypothetical protein